MSLRNVNAFKEFLGIIWNWSLTVYMKARKTRCVSTTWLGWGIRSSTMTLRWRRSKAGPLWGRWRAACTTKWVSDRWWQFITAVYSTSGNSHKFIRHSELLITSIWYQMALWLSYLVKYERIKFLVIALKNAVEVYAWAPKPYHKFMAFKVGDIYCIHTW